MVFFHSFPVEQRGVEIQRRYEKLVAELEREQQKGQQLLTKHHQVRMELEKESLRSTELQQQVQFVLTFILSKVILEQILS